MIVLTLFHQTLSNFAVTTEPTNSNATSYEVWEYMFTLRTSEGWVNGSAGITGVLLLVILGIMFVLSQPFVRERGYFEVINNTLPEIKYIIIKW